MSFKPGDLVQYDGKDGVSLIKNPRAGIVSHHYNSSGSERIWVIFAFNSEDKNYCAGSNEPEVIYQVIHPENLTLRDI